MGRYWVLVFLTAALFFDPGDNTNPHSRWATLVSLCEKGTLNIDEYRHFTLDWARSPNGHTYSNKAPGPVLLAFPAFWLADHWITRGAKSRKERDYLRIEARAALLKFLSFFFQAVPFALLVTAILAWGKSKGVPESNLHFMALAMLFGNTASILMSSFFGHGLAAVFILGAGYCLWREKFLLAGIVWGLGSTCDYGCLALGIPLLVASRRRLPVISGALFPLVGLGIYHWRCFGAPWTFPLAHQNPLFVTATQPIFGVFSMVPSGEALRELLWGSSRGLLWTQPWVILAIPTAFYRRHEIPLVVFAVGGFLLLLFLNSAFGDWHGGTVSGPRYLSSVLPLLALVAGVSLKKVSPVWKISLAVSVAFFVLVTASHPFAPEKEALWANYLKWLVEARQPDYALGVIFLLLALVGAAAVSPLAPWQRWRRT